MSLGLKFYDRGEMECRTVTDLSVNNIGYRKYFAFMSYNFII